MPVDEPFRLVLVQNLVEARKAHVGTVVPIVQPLGRGVGQQQVDAAPFVHLMLQLVRTAAHVLLGVLIGILFIIALTAPKPHDAQTLPCVHVIVHADAAAGLALGLVAAVVVAVHIQDGRSGKVCEIFQILFGQIPAGEDQVDAFQPGAGVIVPQRLGRDI